MKSDSSISLLQLGMIFMLSTGLLNHVIIIPVLMDTAKRDAWISVLLAGGLAFIWIGLLYLAVSRTSNRHFFQWLKQAYHPVVGHTLAIVACLYSLCLCGITVRDTVTWIQFAFSPRTPAIVLAGILLLVCVANAYMGIRSLAYTSGILLPVVVLLGCFVMTANIPNKNYMLLKPIMEYGVKPVWYGAIYVGAGLVELIMVLFLQHHVRSNISYFSLGILVLLLIGLTIGPLIGAIIEFGPDQASKVRYPAYEEWRLVTIGRYIEHLDFLSIYQWFCGAFIRISLTMFVIVDILQVQNKRKKALAFGLIYASMVCAAVLPFSDPDFLRVLTHYLLPWILWIVLGYSAILALLAIISRARRNPQL